MALSASACVRLEQIKIDRTHLMGWIEFVHLHAINEIEQIHAVVGLPKAIPTNPDLL